MKKALILLLCPVFVLSVFNILSAQTINKLLPDVDFFYLREMKNLPESIIKIGATIPDRMLVTRSKVIHLSSFRGKIVVMEFGSCDYARDDTTHIARMDQLAIDFSDKGVEFYHIYTVKPPPGAKSGTTYISVPESLELRRPVVADLYDGRCLLNTVGKRDTISLFVIDQNGKYALFQSDPNPESLKIALEKMITKKK